MYEKILVQLKEKHNKILTVLWNEATCNLSYHQLSIWCHEETHFVEDINVTPPSCSHVGWGLCFCSLEIYNPEKLNYLKCLINITIKYVNFQYLHFLFVLRLKYTGI